MFYSRVRVPRQFYETGRQQRVVGISRHLGGLTKPNDLYAYSCTQTDMPRHVSRALFFCALLSHSQRPFARFYRPFASSHATSLQPGACLERSNSSLVRPPDVVVEENFNIISLSPSRRPRFLLTYSIPPFPAQFVSMRAGRSVRRRVF